MYKSIFGNSFEGMLILDDDGVIHAANEAFSKLCGYHEEELREQHVMNLFSGYDRKEIFNKIYSDLKHNGGWSGHLWSRKKNGKLYYSQYKFTVADDNDHMVLGFCVDLTKEITAEKDYRLFKQMFDNVSEGIILTDKKGIIITVNPAFTEITGYMEDEVVGKNPNLLNSGMQSFDYYIDMWSAIHDTGNWQGEIYNKRKNGEIYLEWLSIDAVRNNGGDITNYVGIFSDVTKRKKAEESLRLYARVFEHSSEGVMITDKKGTIVSVNPSFMNTTGYMEHEVIGKTPRILHSGRQSTDFYVTMWAEIHDKGSWQGELWNRRKNGEIYPQWLSINAVKDDDGSIWNYVGIFTDISFQKESEERLLRMAHYDALTGLPNRFLFNDRLEKALSEAELKNRLVAILFLDLNRFKLVNDSLGHSIGDQLLIAVSERLSACLDNKGTIARLGGDEFTISLNDIESTKDIEKLILKIKGELKAPFYWGNNEFFISSSIGVSIYPYDGTDIETLIKNADSAMYRAKSHGRDFQFYKSEMLQSSSMKMAIANGLHKALDREEFLIYYQPQIDIESKSGFLFIP